MCFDIEDKTLKKYSGNEAHVVIPDGIDSIENRAFQRTDIKSVIIPEGVRRIGCEAFLGCELLEKITLPSTLKKIGGWAFSECTSLKTLTIPDSVTEIGNEAFSNCVELINVNLPSSIEKIYHNVFLNCDKLADTVRDKVLELIEAEHYRFVNPNIVAKDGVEVYAVTRGEGEKKVGDITLVKRLLSYEEYSSIFKQIKGYKLINNSFYSSEGYGDNVSSNEEKIKIDQVIIDEDKFFGLLMEYRNVFSSYRQSKSKSTDVIVKTDGEEVKILDKETWSEGYGDSDTTEYVKLKKKV